jgi:hypothetical protein
MHVEYIAKATIIENTKMLFGLLLLGLSTVDRLTVSAQTKRNDQIF